MTIEVRYAWLQKHPSPVAARGEFHWYPAEGDRELRASFVERARGIDAPAVLWQLAPGSVSWARVFAAIAPHDGRRYVGLVLATAEAAGRTSADLLDALAMPPAAPWSAVGERGGGGGSGGEAQEHDGKRGEAASAGEAGERTSRVEAARIWRRPDATAAEVAAIARALLGGGDAVMADPERADLTGLVASVERWMPPMSAARRRRGAWRSGVGVTAQGAAAQAVAAQAVAAQAVAAQAVAAQGVAAQGVAAQDRVAGLIASAWREPKSKAAQAWQLLCELAEGKGLGVDEVVAELATSEQPTAALTDAERATLGEVRDFAATLHAWGRGRLDGAASAATLPVRLADAVAMRVLACLMADRDPRGPIAEARWHALLPAARRAGLLDGVARRAGSLRALVEVPHA